MKLHPIALAAILCASTAQAVTLTADKAAFDAATAGLALTAESFDAVGPIDVSTVDFGSFTLGSSQLLDDFLGPPPFCLVPNCIAAVGDATLAFVTAQNAVGFFIGGLGDKTLSIAVDGASVVDLPNPSATFTFVGLYDLATPFSSVSIFAPGAPSGAGFQIDEVRLGRVAPIPVPATLPLLLAGLAGLGSVGARRPT